VTAYPALDDAVTASPAHAIIQHTLSLDCTRQGASALCSSRARVLPVCIGAERPIHSPYILLLIHVQFLQLSSGCTRQPCPCAERGGSKISVHLVIFVCYLCIIQVSLSLRGAVPSGGGLGRRSRRSLEESLERQDEGPLPVERLQQEEGEIV
jgi:hypothetical protein